MKTLMIVFCLLCCCTIQAQVIKKDTVIYNYIFRDTVIYIARVVQVEEKKDGIDLSNWGIGPYTGIDYTYSEYWGGGFNYSVGFGVQYYIWRLPLLKKKKKRNIGP